MPLCSVGNAGVSWFKDRDLDSPVAHFLWTTSHYKEKIWSEDRNTPIEKIHAQWIPLSMCSDYVQWLAKTEEPDTESQDCDFEPKISQTSIAQINTEGQLWRRDSNAALPKTNAHWMPLSIGSLETAWVEQSDEHRTPNTRAIASSTTLGFFSNQTNYKNKS